MPTKVFYRIMLDGGIGIYNINSGEIDYEFHRQKKLIYYLNKFHYNKVKGWTPIADFFAFSLIFLALSGLFMMAGKKGIAGRGKMVACCGNYNSVAFCVVNIVFSNRF